MLWVEELSSNLPTVPTHFRTSSQERHISCRGFGVIVRHLQVTTDAGILGLLPLSEDEEDGPL